MGAVFGDCCQKKKEKDEEPVAKLSKSQLETTTNSTETEGHRKKAAEEEEEEHHKENGHRKHDHHHYKKHQHDIGTRPEDLVEDELEKGSEADRILKSLIEKSNIKKLLDEAEETVRNLKGEEPFVQISKDSDPLLLYFQVGDHPEYKEKFHKFLSSYSVEFDPKYFVLRNCVLSPEDRLKSNSNLQSYKTVHRKKVGDTYYLINHVVFKKIPLFNPKETVCIKGVRVLPNGNVIEQNVSVDHPHIPVDGAKERMTILSNPIFYEKTEKGLKAKSFNYVIPKSGMAFSILKSIMNSSYNNTFKGLYEAVKNSPMDMNEIEQQFK